MNKQQCVNCNNTNRIIENYRQKDDIQDKWGESLCHDEYETSQEIWNTIKFLLQQYITNNGMEKNSESHNFMVEDILNNVWHYGKSVLKEKKEISE